MYYYEIAIKKVPHLYTWKSEQKIPLGSRVMIELQNKRKIGIIWAGGEMMPKAKNIIKILNEKILPENSLILAKKITKFYHTTAEKTLSLIVPNDIWKKEAYLSTRKINTKINLRQRLKPFTPKPITSEFLKKIAKFLSENQEGTWEEEKRDFYDDVKIAELLDKSLFWLVPEINEKTYQLYQNLYKKYGDEVIFWHKNLTPAKRNLFFYRASRGKIKIIIGTMSACFLPVPKIKNIIVINENKRGHKNDFTPRFHTREITKILQETHQAQCFFFSVNASLEEKFSRKFSLENPEDKNKEVVIHINDIRNEYKKGNSSPLSEWLQERIQSCLLQNKKIALCINKTTKGSTTICRSCGHLITCQSCRAPLKAYDSPQGLRLMCHSCGQQDLLKDICPKCGSEDFRIKGWNTEIITKETAKFFPEAKIITIDQDKPYLTKKEINENDIFIGTSRITQILPFDSMSLVGVILADIGLSIPDFRMEEKLWSYLTDLKNITKEKAHFILQTFRPEEKIFQCFQEQSPEEFHKWQKNIREKYQLPPFWKMAKLTIINKDKTRGLRETQDVFHQLQSFVLNDKEKKDTNIRMAPSFFPIQKGQYVFHIFIKASKKIILDKVLDAVPINKKIKFDINPINLW